MHLMLMFYFSVCRKVAFGAAKKAVAVPSNTRLIIYRSRYISFEFFLQTNGMDC